MGRYCEYDLRLQHSSSCLVNTICALAQIITNNPLTKELEQPPDLENYVKIFDCIGNNHNLEIYIHKRELDEPQNFIIYLDGKWYCTYVSKF